MQYVKTHCFAWQITQLKIDHNPFAKGFRVCNSTAKMDKR